MVGLWWVYGDQWVIYWLVVAPTPLKNDGVKVRWEDKNVEKYILLTHNTGWWFFALLL
jgi:hypothetical protein